jgi:hypothetical protein
MAFSLLVSFWLLAVQGRDLGIGCARWGNEGMYDLMPLAKGYDIDEP